MNPNPLVTIGLTTYNAEQSVNAAIASALAQEWSPFEIVIVDDCSSDNTPEILRLLAITHPELRVFFNANNRGVAVTRNRILEEARGEFVIFFDDDDESLPTRISEQYERIVQYEQNYSKGNMVICHTARQLVYPNGQVRVESTMGETVGCQAPAGLPVAHRVLIGTPLKDGNGSCPTCSQMARLSTYRAVGGFDPMFRRGEDTELNIRIAMAGGHFVGICEPLVIQHMTKTPDKNLVEEWRNNQNILEKHKSLLEAEGQYSFCKKWIDIKFAWLDGRHTAFTFGMLRLFLCDPLLTIKRLWWATPNLGLNYSFSVFHRKHPSDTRD